LSGLGDYDFNARPLTDGTTLSLAFDDRSLLIWTWIVKYDTTDPTLADWGYEIIVPIYVFKILTETDDPFKVTIKAGKALSIDVSSKFRTNMEEPSEFAAVYDKSHLIYTYVITTDEHADTSFSTKA